MKMYEENQFAKNVFFTFTFFPGLLNIIYVIYKHTYHTAKKLVNLKNDIKMFIYYVVRMYIHEVHHTATNFLHFGGLGQLYSTS